ncbi:sugar ABC transporter permease [Paenibacillus baekrokdamisoli]|uniref:Sugar ABC transporter permease n=1 Tax=Paenibacillus baekrokdamisoli TaxID=1712516 RepID=A0A3G9ITR1_9BACL|nr:carbohydrate ABC transporter permease [Paenibacillus baekrokdamisoli]MBB3070803.1 inositol-phosphate transport system permease protein [Paenibacillus baekrokdamisoli]BBH22257.1 sugar ABC transporter permease [Paenibacillus baekrokdamisoli]
MSTSTLKKALVQTYMTLFTLPIIAMVVWYFLAATTNFTTGQFTLENFNFVKEPVTYSGVILPMIWPIVMNTLLYSLFIVVIEVGISVPTAYAFSRLDFKGKRAAMKFLFLMRSFPGITLIIATFFILVQMNLVNTYVGVVLVAITGSLPGRVYIMKGFFDEVPWDIEWAAMVDGCTRFRAFKKVLVPYVLSGIGAISVFSFLGAYGEWFLFKLLIFNDDLMTLAGYLSKLVTKENQIINYGLITALGLFYTLPIIVFYIFTQRLFMKVNMGGAKQV